MGNQREQPGKGWNESELLRVRRRDQRTAAVGKDTVPSLLWYIVWGGGAATGCGGAGSCKDPIDSKSRSGSHPRCSLNEAAALFDVVTPPASVAAVAMALPCLVSLSKY